MKKVLSTATILATLGLLVSCNPGKARSEKGIEKADLKFPMEYINDAKADENGIYKIGMVLSSPFKGVFSPFHYQDAYDSNIMAMFSSQLFGCNDDYERVGMDDRLAKYSLDIENNQVIIELREGLKWSDGHPLTVDDLIYTYEVLGHKDYTGVRYDSQEYEKILGMKEFHEGKAKTISGLEKVSDTKLIIHASSLSPKLIANGSFLIGSVMPKHYLSDVPMKDLEKSDKIRKHPLSNGEFVLTKLIPGEAVELEPNPHYYKGQTKVGKVILKSIQPQLVLESMKKGEYHSYWSLPNDIYDKYKDLSNVVLLGKPSLYYSYLGFNLGHFDKTKGENIQDRDTPLQDVRVRKAVGYALDMDTISDAFYHGLRRRANSTTPTSFKKYHDSTIEGYPYNPEKAKQLLKEAGYTDTNGDGFVDKDGKNLKLKFATMSGGDTAEPLAQAMMQYWNEVGIEVELTNGRLLEFQLFYEKVQANDDDIDLFAGAWGVGTSLDPTSSAGRSGVFNLSRYVSEENDKLLEAINDPKGFTDENYRSEAYKAWERNYIDQAVVIPLTFRYDVSPVNKNVKQANMFTNSKLQEIPTQVVAEPMKAE